MIEFNRFGSAAQSRPLRSRVSCFCIFALILFVAVPAAVRAEDFIPYVSQQDMRIALESDGRVFSRLLADEMARQGWHTADSTLGSISFYRPVTKELADKYGVQPATDLGNPEYVQTVTGYFYVRPVRVACVCFRSSIGFEGKHVEREVKKVNVPDEVKVLANTTVEKMAGKRTMWISFQE